MQVIRYRYQNMLFVCNDSIKKPALHEHEFVQGDREIQNARLAGKTTIQRSRQIDTISQRLPKIQH